ADAFDLWRVQAVNLWAALPTLLIAHPAGKIEHPGELGLEKIVVHDLAFDVADDATEEGLELAQRPVGALELAGVGGGLMLDELDLADPRIGLAQRDAELLGELDQLLPGPVHQLGVGRVGDVLRLHGGVNNDAGEIAWLHGTGSGRD